MSDEVVKEKQKKDDTLCIGLDIGTMHLVCSRSDTTDVKVTRNVFLPLDSDDIQISELSDISYVEG